MERSSRPFSAFAGRVRDHNRITTSSVAYKGKLYCWSDYGLMLELDLSKSNSAMYRFIEGPEDYRTPGAYILGGFLGVSGGRLLLCMPRDNLNPDHDEGRQPFRVRELKQVVKDSRGKLKWLTDHVTIDCKDIMFGTTSKVLAFYPNNEDVVYWYDWRIFTGNLRGGTLENITMTRAVGRHTRIFDYPFSVPWWPTPIPKTRVG